MGPRRSRRPLARAARGALLLLNPVIDLVKTYTATTAAKAKLHEELGENKRLHCRVQHADDPIVLDAKARDQGMMRPGETPYVDPRQRPLAAARVGSADDRRRLLPPQRRRPGGDRRSPSPSAPSASDAA